MYGFTRTRTYRREYHEGVKRRGVKDEEKMDTIATLIPSLSDEEKAGRVDAHTKEEGRRKRRQRRSCSEGREREKKKGFSRRKCSKKGTRYGSYPRLWPRESVRRRGLHGSHIHLSRYSLSIRGTSRVESMSPPAESVRYDTLKPLETSCRTCT